LSGALEFVGDLVDRSCRVEFADAGAAQEWLDLGEGWKISARSPGCLPQLLVVRVSIRDRVRLSAE
jgi:hypothetical protein